MAEKRVKSGALEVIIGCMFSGKTEELIRQVNRVPYAKLAAATAAGCSKFDGQRKRRDNGIHKP